MKNEEKIDKNTVISASEIGQYYYCSIAWHLQRKGFKPESELLEKGQKKHDELGRLINRTEKKMVKSRILAVMGYIILFFSILIFIFEVIL
jgi:ATP/ADP translocase